MERIEKVELTTLCLVRKDGRYLLQDRVKDDWQGYTLPGGHVEPGESIVDSVIREVEEETGLTILDPRLCGVKQFPRKNGDYAHGRYLVFLFTASEFTGSVRSSAEGAMHWVKEADLDKVNLVSDFHDLMDVMLRDNLSEFQYLVDGDNWNIVKR